MVNYAQVYTGSLTRYAQIDTYVFTASAGDYLDIRAQDNQNGTLSAATLVLCLYGPSGHLVAADTGTYKDSVKLAPMTIPATGEYTLLVYDIEGDDFAGYGLMIWPPLWCIGLRGNINGSFGDAINISDLTYLVDYFFASGPSPLNLNEADMNADTKVNISDLTFLVEYLFAFGPPPEPC